MIIGTRNIRSQGACPLVKESTMKPFSTTVWYGGIGIAALMVVSCTKECLPPSGMPTSMKAATASPLMTEEGRSETERRAVLSLNGPFCEFYLPQVEGAIERVPGVIGVDFKTVKGGVVVTYEAGKLSPIALLSAVNSVKGDGYFCKAKVVPG
jgi:mercuric ion binding protein